MSFLVLSRNGEQSFNKYLTPDPDPVPDRFRGGLSLGYTPSCVKKINSIGDVIENCEYIHHLTELYF